MKRRIDGLLLVLGVVVLWAVPHRIAGDGAQRYDALERVLLHGSFANPRYSLVGPLLAAPLWLVGRVLGDARAGAAALNVALFTAALVLLARELRRFEPELSPDARRTTLLLLVFASMFPNHVQLFYGEVLTALAVTLGVFWLARDRPIAGWTAIVIGAVNTPASIVGVGLVALRVAWRKRSFRPIAVPAVVLLLVFAENFLTRGSPFASGYGSDAGFKTVMPYSGRPGFSYPFVLGVLAILLSFGKGLVFFTPGLFVPVDPRAPASLRWVHGTLLAFVVGLVLVYARWWSWYGGSFWGPRFFLVASVPAALSLATRLADPPALRPGPALLLLGAALWSFWVGVDGLVLDQTGLERCFEADYALEFLCHFTPEWSALFHPFVDFSSSVPARGPRGLVLAVCVVWVLVGVWVSRRLLAVVLARMAAVLTSAARMRKDRPWAR